MSDGCPDRQPGRSILARLTDPFRVKLGRCSRCMRQATFGALGAWALVAALYFTWPHRLALIATVIVASALTVLMLAHMIALTTRVVSGLARVWPRGDENPQAAGGDTVALAGDRRAFLGTATKLAGGALGLALFGSTARAIAQTGSQGSEVEPQANPHPHPIHRACAGACDGTGEDFTIRAGACPTPCDPTVSAGVLGNARTDARQSAIAECQNSGGANCLCAGGRYTDDAGCITFGPPANRRCFYFAVSTYNGTCRIIL